MAWTLEVRVIPGARKTEAELTPEGLKVRLAAPAVEGKANKALLAYLAGRCGLRKSGVTLIRGEKARIKVVELEGEPPAGGLEALFAGTANGTRSRT